MKDTFAAAPIKDGGGAATASDTSRSARRCQDQTILEEPLFGKALLLDDADTSSSLHRPGSR